MNPLAIAPPRVLLAPARLLPESVLCHAFCQVLNATLREPLREGELDFLRGRCLRVEVSDTGLGCSVSLSATGRLVPAARRLKPDVLIAGAAADLVLVASRREDPDTLFFQRRLRLEGDTELGLEVKNLMDGLELDALAPPLRWGLERAADAVQRTQACGVSRRT